MAPKPEVKPPVEYDMILAVRRLKGGAFSGLYEVVQLDKNQNVVRVITDANNKATALGLMTRAAEKV